MATKYILIDNRTFVLHTLLTTWGNMIVSRSQSHRLSGLNPDTLPRGKSSRLAFLLPVTSRHWRVGKHESAEPEKRQGEMNNRVIRPRSGRLTDYTREFVTWVMRLQANYRIEQSVLRNVVLMEIEA